MVCAIEEEQSIENKTIIDNSPDISMEQDTENPSQQNKRPEWHKRSPIQDVFFRYGEYFS